MSTATIIDGSKVATAKQAELAAQTDLKPGLGIIVATGDPATATYVERKREAADRLGWPCMVVSLDASASEADIINTAKKFNDDPKVTGYIVQLPLPDGVDREAVFAAVDPRKDADGLNPENLKRLYAGEPTVIPATPRGILSLLDAYDLPVKGKTATVVGQGILTGKPLAALLEQRGADVTRVDRSVTDLKAATKNADLLVVATGNIDLITAGMVKPGAVIIDVGINRLEEKITGDVDFENVKNVASAITPVPGGVGPMTVISLLENVADLAKNTSA